MLKDLLAQSAKQFEELFTSRYHYDDPVSPLFVDLRGEGVDRLEAFLSSQISSAFALGVEEGGTAQAILFKRLKEWNEEWRAENPKERSLTIQDAKKLIEWKVEQARKLGEESGIKKAVEIVRKTAQNHNHSAGCGEVCKAFSEVVEALQSNLTTKKD